MGYAGKRAGGILPASVVVPTPSRTASSFFELWLNAKLRHGNTVVLKIRNARGADQRTAYSGLEPG